MSYKDDLKIDEGNLHGEWKDQPFLQMKYVEEATHADVNAKRAKENLEIEKAELYLSIRKMKEFNKEKITEAIIDAEIKVSNEYKEAHTVYFKALEKSKILNGAVDAFEQRKCALENIVKLHGRGYFSQPSEKLDQEITEEVVQTKVRESLTKPKRKERKRKEKE